MSNSAFVQQTNDTDQRLFFLYFQQHIQQYSVPQRKNYEKKLCIDYLATNIKIRI